MKEQCSEIAEGGKDKKMKDKASLMRERERGKKSRAL